MSIPNLQGNEEAYLRECIRSNFVSSVGPFVDRIEEIVAENTGADAATATCSGTAGLHAALTVVGVKPNDLVIMPSFTFIATANAVQQCGASPWLFDVDATLTLNASKIAETLELTTYSTSEGVIHKGTGRRVGGVIPVHTLGFPADVSNIFQICENYGLPVVVDAAAALGASRNSQRIGEMAPILGVLSFNGNKTFTAGGGGAVFGPKLLVEATRHLCTTARVSPDYDHDLPGFNYRMPNICAAVGVAQLERLREFTNIKRQIQEKYSNFFNKLDNGIEFPQITKNLNSSYWLSYVILPKELNPKGTKLFRQSLRARGIDARSFWKPVHLQEPYAQVPRESMDVTQNKWWRILTLPCSTSLTEDEQSYVCRTIKELLS